MPDHSHPTDDDWQPEGFDQLGPVARRILNWLTDNNRLDIIATLADRHLVYDEKLRAMAEVLAHESGLAEELEEGCAAARLGQMLVDGARGYADRSSSDGTVTDVAEELNQPAAEVYVIAYLLDQVGDLAGRVFCGADPRGRVIEGASWQVADQLVTVEGAAEIRRHDPGTWWIDLTHEPLESIAQYFIDLRETWRDEEAGQ